MNKPNVQPDGPCGIYQWRHNGVVADGDMQPRTWEMAKYLFERRNTFVLIGDLIGVGKPFEDEDIEDQSIKRQGSKISRWFKSRGIPLRVGTRRDRIWLSSGP